LTPPPPPGETDKPTALTFARILAVSAIVAVALGLAAILLGSGGETEYKLRFQNAGQLVKGDEVQVGGRAVGSISDIRLTSDNRAEVTIEMHELAPLHEGTTAVIRQTSLSGIANRYVSLSLGPNSAPELPDGATVPAERTTTAVDLDQLFNTLDPQTRRGLRQVVQGSAQQYRGKGAQANQGARYFAPAISTTDRLVREVMRDQASLTAFIVNSARLVGAVAERRDDLASLVSNANATTGAIAAEQRALAEALDLLPATLRRGNTTFVNLRATLGDLDVLVAESKPATRRLAPFLRQLRPLVARARPTIRDLRRLVRERGPDNDLVEALRKTPRLQRVATPTFRRTVATLDAAEPVIAFARPYAPELVGWVRDFGQGASNYDANGHFARIAPQFNAFSYTDQPVPLLTPQPPSERLSADFSNFFYPSPRRCPGAASQMPNADGSTPFRDADGNLDCDPNVRLPGP
jgi:phospholipid/cholesterol/gamma-HCH transport system substrate-binding protein